MLNKTLSLPHLLPACDVDRLAGNPARLVADEKARHVADILRVTDVAEGLEMLEASEDVDLMGAMVGLMSADDLERGLELARMAGELWTVSDVVDLFEMPVLSAFLEDRGEQLQKIAVDEILQAASNRALSHVMAATGAEIKELGELKATDVTALPEEVELDDLSRAALERNPDQATIRKIEILQGYAARKAVQKSRKLIIRFLVSPVELIGNDAGQVTGMRLVRNELYATEAGTLRPKPTDQFEELPVGLVFRSVGYRGVPLPGVPFNDSWGVILNEEGRVLDPVSKQPLVGEYTAGWIKRGPTGVIGTNKPDAVETVKHMLTDLAKGNILKPSKPCAESAEELVKERQPDYFTFDDWLHLDAIEVSRGEAQGRPRVKFTSVAEMIEAKQM